MLLTIPVTHTFVRLQFLKMHLCSFVRVPGAVLAAVQVGTFLLWLLHTGPDPGGDIVPISQAYGEMLTIAKLKNVQVCAFYTHA